MLKALFASETRERVLSLFLLNAEKKYTLPQVVKETACPSKSVSKELDNLVAFGLLKISLKDKWIVNKNFIIFPELRTLIAKAQLVSSQKFIDGLKEISTLSFLALTGVFTGDEMVKTDILMVGKIKKRPFTILLKRLEKEMGREINYTIIDETEFSYRREVMDIFLYNILHGKTLFLIDTITPEGIEQEKLKINLEENENESSDT